MEVLKAGQIAAGDDECMRFSCSTSKSRRPRHENPRRGTAPVVAPAAQFGVLDDEAQAVLGHRQAADGMGGRLAGVSALTPGGSVAMGPSGSCAAAARAAGDSSRGPIAPPATAPAPKGAVSVAATRRVWFGRSPDDLVAGLGDRAPDRVVSDARADHDEPPEVRSTGRPPHQRPP
jgi:hypothetical protein